MSDRFLPGRPKRGLLWALALTVPFALGNGSLWAADSGATGGDPRDNLIALWKGQKAAVVTARYKISLFRYGESSSKSLTRDQFLRLLPSLDLARVPAFLETLRSQFPPPDPDVLDSWPVTVEILEDGARSRNDWPVHFAELGSGADSYVFDSKEEVQHHTINRQASVFAGRSGIQILRTSNLRYLPPLRGDGGRDQFEVLSRSQGRSTLRRGLTSIVADETTGFVHHAVAGNPQQRVAREVLQYGPRTYPGGILLPTVSAHVNYDSTEKISLLSVYYIREAVLNQEIPADAFTVAVPKGTNVVDFRKDPNRPSERLAFEPVADVLRFANDGDGPQEEAIRQATHRGTLLGLAGLVFGTGLVVVAVRLLRNPPPARRSPGGAA